METLTSPANPRIKAIAALAQKKHRADTGLFWAEGSEMLARAQQAGWECVEVLSTTPLPATTILTSEAALAKITGKTNPQPILSVLKQRWAGLPEAPAGMVLVLDRLRDPANLGTIVRTAAATGVQHIVLVGESCDPYSPEAVRASAGGLFHNTLTACTETEFRIWRARHNLPTLGTTMQGTPLMELSPVLASQRPLALLLGNESAGLATGLLATCTHTVALP
ncbi:MAG: RNA methyltransferase, partial [Alphaproteobacteria bacterium]